MNCARRSLLLIGLLALCQTVGAEQLLIPVSGRPAPILQLASVDGTPRSLQDYSGRVLVINFWATWCPPCRAEMPSLQRLLEQTKAEGVEVIAVAVADDPAAVERFAAEYGLEFALLLDPDGSAAQRWKARVLPSTFVLDAERRIRLRATGERVWDAPEVIEQIIDVGAR